MRIETKKVKIYKFNELSEEIQEKVVDEHREFLRDIWDGDFVTEYWKEKLEENGFSEVIVYYSGFWSQGDGACFDFNALYFSDGDSCNEFKKLCKYMNIKIPRRILDWMKTGKLEIEITVYKNSYGYHYSHEKTRVIDCTSGYFEYEDQKEKFDFLVDFLKTFNEDFQEEYRDICRKIYKELKDSYNHDRDLSGESIKEDIIENDYEFLENGKIY